VTTGELVSVNVVHELIPDGPGALDRTAIDKRPVPGRVGVGRLGAAGDVQYDTRHHGGPDKALYAYALEDLDWWSAELGRALRPGQFGENLTVRGVDVTTAVVGEQWRIGTDGVVVEVTMPRIPCKTFQGWMAEPRWVKRFFSHGAPGAYLRVTGEGSVGAGDPIHVSHRPAHGVTLAEVFDLGSADAERLRLVLDTPGVAPDLQRAVRRTLRVPAR
jgi:MOSC domain-containing protein YiiM